MKNQTAEFHRADVRQAGQAMVTALTVVAITAAVTAIAISRTASTARMASRSSDYTETERVADGLIEYAFGRWQTKMLATQAGALDANALAQLTPASMIPPGYSVFSDGTNDGTFKIVRVDYLGAPGGSATPAALLTKLDDYPGWRGYTYNYRASVRLRADTNMARIDASNSTNRLARPVAGTRRLFQYIEVPIFQSMYFFEDNLEIYRPATMIVSGLVHSNSRLLLSGSADQTGVELTLMGNVSYAGGTAAVGTTPAVAGYTTTEPPYGGPAWGFGYSMPLSSSNLATAVSKMEAPTFGNGGEAAQLSKVTRYEPLGKKPADALSTTDTNPNNDSYHELIEAPSTGIDPSTGQVWQDPPEIQKRRLYNKAGVLIEVNGATITSTNRATAITLTLKNNTGMSQVQIDAIKGAITKNSIYDEREAKMVNLVNLDMSVLTTQLNGATNFNGVLYVRDVTPVASGGAPNTIRLQKGQVLPNNGLTVASENPVYIQGDYNVGPTTSSTSVPANATGNPNNTDSPVVAGYSRKPSAVIADAVMFLSNNWNDSNAASSSTSKSNRIASNTTYNTAIMAGFIPSGWVSPSGTTYGYSGGANNFPRFLEDWSNKTCTYYGSMVELFQSQTFTGQWNTGDIYSPPKRCWNFDTLFSSVPPPGSVDVIVITRGSWARL